MTLRQVAERAGVAPGTVRRWVAQGLVPQYEGYDYVLVGDNILIIDPDTMEIVDVIPV